MSKARHSSLVLGLLTAVLAPASALSVGLISPAAAAAPAAPKAKPKAKVAPAKAAATCSVFAVLASKEAGELPAELSFLAEKLAGDEFAAYKSFSLVDVKPLPLVLTKPGEVSLKTGHTVGLTLLEITPERLELNLRLTGREGKQLLSTRYGIKDKGLLMVGAGKYTDKGKNGKVFVAIQCSLPATR